MSSNGGRWASQVMATKDPDKKPRTRPASAKDKIAEQRQMKEDLSGALMAGRLAASTETVTRVRVPGVEIDKAAPKAKKGTIPPPRRPKRPGPPPAARKKKTPQKKAPPKKAPPKKAPSPAAKKPARKGGKNARKVAWDPKRLAQFIAGVITLGELEGISKEEQYEMAKLGHQLLRQGKLDDAKKVFDGLVTLDPRDAYFHLALGSIAQRGDDLEEAEQRYGRALEIDPYSPHALANRGEVRMMLGRMVEGAKDLMRALEEDPDAVHEGTKRARATIGVVLQQLEEAGVSAKKERPGGKTERKRPGPTKKAGVRAPPGSKPAPRARKPAPRGRGRRPGPAKK